MEKQRKSGEMMQLLELATKEQKTTAAASHKPLTIRAPMRPADKGSTSGHHSTPSKGPPSTNKPPSSGLKKLRQTTLNVKSAAIKSVAGPPQKGQAVEIQTVSHDSVQPHPSLATKTAAELGLTSPSTSNSKSVHEVQLNNSDSMEDMDTSNEFEGGEMFASSANEGNEEDVVHCLCGSIEDEGFMIQVCDQQS